MGRKADINNIIRDAEHKDKIVIEAENHLETAKANSAEAWDKVRKRRKELEQENNNALAEISRKLFWADISAKELQSKWDELLLISEVKEYIEFEKANHEAELAKKASEEAAKKEVESQSDGNNNICTDNNSEQENVTTSDNI